MHFIDFLLHIICFICWCLKTIYVFSFEYLIPVIGHILPVLTKRLSQLFSLLLRLFFTYISPCIIQLLTGTTFVFTKVLNGISIATMTIIESDINLEYAHAIIMILILVLITYFHITDKIYRFFYVLYQMISLYLRFMLNVLKVVRFCLNFIYRKVVSALFSKRDNDNNNSKAFGEKEKRRQRRSSSINNNGINGSAHSLNNGSATTHRLRLTDHGSSTPKLA